MAIAASNVTIISGSATGAWIPLAPGPNILSVSSPSWDGSKTATLEQSDDDSELTKSALDLSGVALAPKANKRYVVDGPGYVRATVSAYDGQPVTVTVKGAYQR
jgi:hypothetical protein